MKQTKNEIIKPIFYSKTAILTLLILVSIWAVLTVVPLTYSQSSDPKPAATPKPIPTEKVLDEDAATAKAARILMIFTLNAQMPTARKSNLTKRI